MKRLSRHMTLLQYLESLSSSEQKNIINGANADFIKLFSEICKNISHQNISLTQSQIKKLKRFENEILKLSQKKHSIKSRKKILTTGSFLSVFLSEIIPSLIQAILSHHEENVHG